MDQQVLTPRLKVAIHPDVAPFAARGSGDRPPIPTPSNAPGASRCGELGRNTVNEEEQVTRETTLTDEDATAARLRLDLAEAIVKNRADIGTTVDETILEAVRTVPRHLFTPGISLEEAYADAVPIMKRDGDGVAISSVSAPWLQATMLQQAQITPGMNVLEIGSGGYNAALIAELVGPKGTVVSLDIDPEVCERAERGLTDAGYDDVVTVVCADGEYGAEQFAPFDRILVTVSAPDIPPAWTEQLADDGRLIVPLRVRGLERSFVFQPEAGRLVCTEFELAGFVPMQGAAENRQREVSLHGDGIVLRVDDRQPVEAEPLGLALEGPRCEAWSGVLVGGMEPWDDLDMWLATVAPTYGYLTATDQGLSTGLVTLTLRWGMSAVWDQDSFAYLTLRPVTEDRTEFEFGAYAHGPNAAELADQMVAHLRSWDRDQRRGTGPHVEVHPKTALDGDVPHGLVVEKRHSRVTVSWPQTPGRTGQVN
ncbi:methyltransferase, FxLD system [Glycomyces sp. A-F 0318]|uniref:methyltransferase, FxLD system n=1 Tax=Glycomyces amatae TaxID=2881355 RepID=UPI001E4C0202|nr:methyltransferase, FxLD system [Glycomyces amatae]